MKLALRLSLLLTLSLLSIGASCGHKPPPVTPPTPPPTPPPVVEEGRPTSSVYLTSLIRNDGTGRWTMGGKPTVLVGATPCWPTDGTGEVLRVEGRPIPYLWPLVSTEWMEHTAKKGANLYHMRPGPIGSEDTCCGLQSIGGPYLAGTPRLPNPAFWSVVHKAHHYAGKNGLVIQDSVFDGWVAKNDQSIGGDMHMPFPPQDASTPFSLPINPSVRRWVFDYVHEVCNYANLMWEVGNETSLGPGWSPAWERSMFALIREAEQQTGCDGIVHVIGSNSRDFDGPYDYMVSHWPESLTGPQSGKPMMINEYNPSLNPAQFKNLLCTAKKAGQTFFYWRSDGTDARQDESLNMLAACDAPPVCPTPQPDRSKLGWSVPCKPNGVCDATPLHTKDIGYCTSIGKGIGPDGVTPNATCSIRNECPDTAGYEGMCESRVACEQFALSVPGVCTATAPLWKSDGEVVLEDAFGFRARCNGCTWLKACNCDGSNCGDAVLR